MRYRIGRIIYPTKDAAIAAAIDTVTVCHGKVEIHIDRIRISDDLVPILERALSGHSVDEDIRAHLQRRDAWCPNNDQWIEVKFDKSGAVVIEECDIPY